jgi:hypothetical protein
MSTVLFLDDDPIRCARVVTVQPAATVVTTAPEAIAALQRQAWDVVSLDHDLGGEYYVDSARDDTGMGVVRWITAHKPAVGRFLVHSWNDVGGDAMVAALHGAGYRATRVYFGFNGFPEDGLAG